jgi:hypothetical protein
MRGFCRALDGIEPSTPSLPWRLGEHRSQPTATVWACFPGFRADPVCHRLPPVATTGQKFAAPGPEYGAANARWRRERLLHASTRSRCETRVCTGLPWASVRGAEPHECKACDRAEHEQERVDGARNPACVREYNPRGPDGQCVAIGRNAHAYRLAGSLAEGADAHTGGFSRRRSAPT